MSSGTGWRLLTLAVIAALWGCGHRPQPSATFRIGYQKGGTLHLLRIHGELDRRLAPLDVTVEWIEFPAGPQMLEALSVHGIDLASCGDTPVIFAQAAGDPVVYVANAPPDDTGDSRAILVRPESSIRAIADLRGKRIAVQKGSGTHNFLVQVLEKAGIPYSAVKPVYLPPQDARPAFDSGNVDAWAIWDPYLAIAQHATGARVVANGKGIVTAGSFYLSTHDFVKLHSDWLRAALEQIDQMGRWEVDHPREAAGILAPQIKLDIDVLEAIERRARPQSGPYRSFRPIDVQVMASQQAVADIFLRIGLLPKRVDVRTGLLSAQEYAALTPQ